MEKTTKISTVFPKNILPATAESYFDADKRFDSNVSKSYYLWLASTMIGDKIKVNHYIYGDTPLNLWLMIDNDDITSEVTDSVISMRKLIETKKVAFDRHITLKHITSLFDNTDITSIILPVWQWLKFISRKSNWKTLEKYMNKFDFVDSNYISIFGNDSNYRINRYLKYNSRLQSRFLLVKDTKPYPDIAIQRAPEMTTVAYEAHIDTMLYDASMLTSKTITFDNDTLDLLNTIENELVTIEKETQYSITKLKLYFYKFIGILHFLNNMVNYTTVIEKTWGKKLIGDAYKLTKFYLAQSNSIMK